MSSGSEFKQRIEAQMPNVRKAMVILAIEKTLLDFSEPTFDLVIRRLEEKYHCYLCDCCENPIYLQNVLQELFGNVSKIIIETMGENLRKFSDSQKNGKLLDAI